MADRIAQTVVRLYLEPKVEPVFHPDSYGYRPGRSALQAVGVCRERCWRSDWVIELDIKSFFDSVPHDLVMRAVRRHTDERCILLYVERWLTAPLQREDGTLVPRDRGTPQGSSISPLLANLFLHYAFDLWMLKEFPDLQFERVLRRWGGSLQERVASSVCSGRHHATAGAMWFGSASRQNAHRVLQGCGSPS